MSEFEEFDGVNSSVPCFDAGNVGLRTLQFLGDFRLRQTRFLPRCDQVLDELLMFLRQSRWSCHSITVSFSGHSNSLCKIPEPNICGFYPAGKQFVNAPFGRIGQNDNNSDVKCIPLVIETCALNLFQELADIEPIQARYFEKLDSVNAPLPRLNAGNVRLRAPELFSRLCLRQACFPARGYQRLHQEAMLLGPDRRRHLRRPKKLERRYQREVSLRQNPPRPAWFLCQSA